MSRKVIGILLGVMVLYLLGSIIYQIINIHRRNHPNVKPGQVWVRNAKDPFKPKSDTIYILEVNGDYSKYRMNGKEDSDKNFWVVYNAELIKDVE